MMRKKWIVLIVAVSLMLAACSSNKDEGKGPVTVATMIDSEGAILGNMLLLLLEQDGFETVDKIGLGTPDILRKALESGEVDLVIDYTGSGQYYGVRWPMKRLGRTLRKAIKRPGHSIRRQTILCG